MSLVTYASEWNSPGNNNDISGEAGRGSLRGNGKARTLKNRDREPQHQSSINGSSLRELKDSVYGESPGLTSTGASNSLGDFVPHPQSAGAERKITREKSEQKAEHNGPSPVCELGSKGDGPCSVEGFDDLANARINDYYARTVPMYQEGSVQSAERDVLLAKLNYMIHLLEEQRDEKTGHVTEEIILYSFLGIFMIFMVDSFARAGKYVR